MAENVPEISVVVPTYREESNLRPLLERLGAVLGAAGRGYEVLIVDDDSQDGTERTAGELAGRYPLRLIVRTCLRDLSLAVLEGLQKARGKYLVVMDADLSHPPEQIPAMLEPLARGDADFVIGSRYVPGGRTEDWGGRRRLNSYVATLLARPLTGRVNDPMAGFFALPREVFERGKNLRPIGYKIGLELLCRCGCERVVEVPITFQNRVRGESKLSLKQQALYLMHLERLYREYRKGWGLLIRPLLWVLLGGVQALRRATAFASRKTPAHKNLSDATRLNKAHG